LWLLRHQSKALPTKYAARESAIADASDGQSRTMTDADTIVIGDQIAGPVVSVGVLKREHDESIAHARPLANTEAVTGARTLPRRSLEKKRRDADRACLA